MGGKRRARKSSTKMAAKSKADEAQNKAIVSIKKEIRSMKSDFECKYVLQSEQIFSNLQTAPQQLLLNGMVRGDTVQTREGDKILGKSIVLKGNIIQQLSAGPYASCVRLICAAYKCNRGATTFPFSAASPAVGYLFDNQNTNGPYTYQMYNFNNTDLGVFKILWDKVFCISQDAATIAKFRPFYKKIKLNDKMSTYQRGNAGTGADIEQWSYWFIAFSDIDAAQTGCNVRFDSAFYFQDN